MIIKNAKFVTSVADASKILSLDAPEIAIVGRSNVGKSSFINFLTNNGRLAKTSSAPGRTRLVNYFELNGGQLYFVDLPGYGFAKVAQSEKKKWGDLIEGYLQGSGALAHVFVLVDIRHIPTDDDALMLNYLYHYSIPFTVIATKADKLSRMKANEAKTAIASKLGIGRDNVLVVSSQNKTGKEAVLDAIDKILSETKNGAQAQL